MKESLSNGLSITKTYDNWNRLLSLQIPHQGRVVYTYDPLFLRSVERYSSSGKLLYTHTYEEYDLDCNLQLETLPNHLGEVVHTVDERGQKSSIASPYFTEEYHYDPSKNLIARITDGSQEIFSYDDLSQLATEKSKHSAATYQHDSLYNRREKNGTLFTPNSLHEIFPSDPLGNQQIHNSLSQFHLTYTIQNELIEALSDTQRIEFSYDPLGRRLSKRSFYKNFFGWREASCENYLYHNETEIGAFTPEGEPINLLILGGVEKTGQTRAVAVESGKKQGAVLSDLQGSVRRVIDLQTKKIVEASNFTPFGEKSSSVDLWKTPWGFSGKRYDAELGLLYFGKRYYDPSLGRWLTVDPAGFLDSIHPYQYALNNPFRYYDPDGQFIIAIPLVAFTFKLLATAAVTAFVAYQIEQQSHHSNSGFSRGVNEAIHDMVQKVTAKPRKLYYQECAERNPHVYDKKHTPDQEAISELVKEQGKKGVSNVDADTLLEWAKETGFPHRDDRGKLDSKGRPHWKGGEHIHLGPKHVKVVN